MKVIKTILLSIFIVTFILNSFTLKAQNQLIGQVTDDDNQPLAFVNILVNGNNRNGTISDIDGRFSFENIQIGDELHLSYLGYEPLIYSIQASDFEKNVTIQITIQMTAKSYKLEEVTVFAGENPAHRIIKKVFTNRNQNNPDKYFKYRCETYNKMRFSMSTDYKRYQKEVIDKRQGEPTEQQRLQDLDVKSSQQFSEQYHLALMETVTDKQFIYPTFHKEVVLHNKVSGFKRPEFVALAKDIQPFAFYDAQITILDKKYINPISRGSTKIYYFNWIDTLINAQDTTFIITFRPKKGKNFQGLKGTLYVHSKQFAIQNVIAEPADTVKTIMRIEQKYKYHTDAEKWFPEQLNVEAFISDYPDKYLGLHIDGKSYIRKVDFQPNIKPRDFTRDKYEIADDAFDLTQNEWNEQRMDTLSQKELKTYTFIDSLSRVYKFEELMKASMLGSSGKLSWGIVDFNLSKVLSFNAYEGTRLGLGIYTNDQFIKNFTIGGYLGYGWKDKAFKYGGDAALKISKKHKTYLKAGYQKDLKTPAALEMPRWEFPFSNTMEDIGQPIMDDFEQIYGEVETAFLKFGTLKLRYAQQNITPNSDYQYYHSTDTIQSFDFQEFKATLRYAFGEQTVTFMGVEVPNPTKYPIIHFNFTTGILENTAQPYQKYILGIEQEISLHRLGQLQYNIEAGLLSGNQPWTKLFNSRGLGGGLIIYSLPNRFFTMQPNEFLSSRFAHLFLKYKIGKLSRTSKSFQPDLSLVHQQAWGDLNNSINHNQTFKTLEQGYFESGIELNNIYRMNYLNIGYYGIGVGVYMRHGAYQFDDVRSNIAYRLLATFEL